MTREELKSLPHLKLVEENTTTLHIHTEDGYTLYRYNKETYKDEETEIEKTYCGLLGSNCYYFPIYDEYVKYEIITTTEYLKLKREFDELEEDKKLEVVNKWLGE